MIANDSAFCGVANLVHTDEVASTKSASYGLASGANEPGTRSSAGEHALHTGGVVGSIPTASTIRRRRDRPALRSVYFVRSVALNVIKIGSADDPKARIRNLQVGTADELVLEGYWMTDDAERLEAILHQTFADQWVRGEWFKPSPDLLEVVASTTKQAPHGVVLFNGWGACP